MKTKCQVLTLCFWIPILSLLLTGCGFNRFGWRSVAGSGNTVQEKRTVANFQKVALSGTGELTIVQGGEENLTIETDDNLMPLIKTEVTNGQLQIGPDGVNLRPTKHVRYELHLKKLNSLHLSGSLKATTGELKTDALALHISGSGTIEILRLEAGELEIQVSGSGSTKISGKLREQHLHISGSGNHWAENLESNVAEVSISGSGHAKLWVKEQLDVKISGSGNIQYFGAPQVSQHISGSGKVKALGTRENVER